MKLRSGYEQQRARVEMLPLIDIVFLLLVFFIYAMLSMVVHRGMKVRLPGAATAEPDRRDYIGISIAADNTVYLDHEPIEPDALPARIRTLRARDSELPVFISGDVEADFGVSVRVLDRLRQAGVTDVSFEARQVVEP